MKPELKKFIATKHYVETGHMSNQQKAEFLKENFHIQIFWGGHGKFLVKT
jgi:hypothetical protein